MGKPEKVERLICEINIGLTNYKKEFLIGLIKADYESYCELMEFARLLINKRADVPRDEKSMILSIALVLFAINEFQNGQFWNELASRLDINETEVMKIGKISLVYFCKKNGLYFHVGNKNKGYVTSILVHAILPNASIEKFFEFLYDLYFRDLEEDYIEVEVEELINYMCRLFSKYIEDDDISLIVQGSKMTIANQHLPKAFRIAFVKAISVVAPIFERILFNINQLNYNGIIEYLENDRFDEHFEQYSYTIKEGFKRSANKKNGIERVKKFRKAQYFYEQGKLYLQVPKQIIDSDFIGSEIFMEVIGNGLVIYQERVLLTKSRLFFKSEQAVVCLPAFYTDLEFRLISENKSIYSSSDVLKREYIIFDMDGKEILPKNLTDDTVKVITNAETEVLSDDAQIDIAYFVNYRISTAFLNEESLLLIGDKVLSTNIAAIRNEICTKKKYDGVTIKDSKKLVFDVFSDVPEIQLRIPYKKRVYDFILSINNKNYQLEDATEYKLKLISDGSGDELGIFRIADYIIKDKFPTRVVIREKGSNRIYLDESIFILKSLQYEFDQKYYYNDKVANIIRLEAEGIDFLGASFPQKVNVRLEDNFKIKFVYDDVTYQMTVGLPVLRWRLGNLNSVSSKFDDIWWEEIEEQKLYIKFPNHLLSQLYVMTGESCEKLQGKANGNEYKFSIEHLFQIRNQEPIMLGVIISGKEERIVHIHYKPFIKDFSIAYCDRNRIFQGLYAQWTYIGRGDLYVDIIYTPTNDVIKQYVVQDDDHIMDRDVELYYSEHEIEIYQLNQDDFFGGDIEKNVLVHETFIVGDPVIVCTKNKLLKGRYCMSEEDKYELSNFYLKDITFSQMRGLYKATGMYFIKDKFTGKEREWYFTNHNPFFLKPVNVEFDKFIFEILDKDKDGLIYDVKTKYVNPREEEYNLQRYKLIDTVELEIVK